MEELWKVAAPISVVLTFVTWLCFKYSPATSDAPLSKTDLVLVVAFWFALTLGARWLWRRIRKKPAGGSQ